MWINMIGDNTLIVTITFVIIMMGDGTFVVTMWINMISDDTLIVTIRLVIIMWIIIHW